jgi:excisionase family DNA binding protein
VARSRGLTQSKGRQNTLKHNNSSRKYVTLSEAADYLGVTPRTVRQMVADSRLRAYKLGDRVVRLRLDEIDAAMQPVGGEV